MQIIAKAVLTFLGISTFANLCQNLSMLISLTLTRDTSVLRAILSLPVAIILLTAIIYLLIFKNDRLACKMAGSGEKLNHESETLWLAGSLRMVAIFYGLILLSGSVTMILNILALPLYMRSLISEIFELRTFPKSLAFSPYQWTSIVYNFLQATLAVYLLYGWPQFVRFQLNLRKSESSLDKKLYAEGIKK